MVDKYWEQAKKDRGAETVTSTREATLELRSAIKEGRIVPEQMEPSMRRGVELGISLLDDADRLEARETGGEWRHWNQPAQENIPVEDEFKGGQQTQGVGRGYITEDALLGDDEGVDNFAFHPSDFRLEGPIRSEKDKYSGPILKSAILDAALNDTPLTAAVVSASNVYKQTGDEEAPLRQQTDALVSEQEEDIQKALQNINVFQPTGDVAADLASLKEDMTYLAKHGVDPDYVFWTTVANPDIREEVVKQFATNDKVRDLVNQTFESMGVVDWFRNIGGIFLPGKDIYDNVKFTGSAFSADEYIEKFIENFQSYSPEKQEELLPGIKEWVEESLPELRAVEFYKALADPQYERETSGFNWFYAGLSAVDFAGWALTVVAAGVQVNRARKTAKALVTAHREDVASEVVGTALTTGTDEAIDILEMNKLDVVNTASPFATEFLAPNSVDNLSVGIGRNVAKFEKEVAEATEAVKTGKDMLVERAFTPEEVRKLEVRKQREFVEKNGVENAKTIERDDLGFTLEYEAFDEEGVSLGLKQQRFNHTLQDKQMIEVNPVGMFSRWIASPLTFLKGEEGRKLVKQAERLDNQQAKLLNDFRRLQRDAVSSIIGDSGIGGLSPLARKKMEELDFILLKGDQEKEVYTVKQLMSGELGKALKEDQVEAYYKTRSLMDALLDIRENAAKREAVLRGEAGVFIKGKTIVAKPYEEVNNAKASLKDSGRRHIYVDDSDPRVMTVDELDLDASYDGGFSLVRLSEPTDFGNGNKVFFALVENDMVGDLPRNILPRRTGYIPKINTGAAYFVKQLSTHTVDGKTILATDTRANPKTLRAFARREDAEAYELELTKKAKAEGKSQDDVIYRTLEDRELEQEASLTSMGEEHALARPGGLFSGSRAEDLLYGIDADQIDRLDSFTSISHNLSNLAKYVSRNEWRLGMEKMAVETANSLQGSGNRVYKSFDDLVKAPMGTKNGRTIRALHSQIEDWMSWPSSEEMAFKYAIQSIIDSSIGGKMPKKALDLLFDLKNSDPTAAMRASAFHGLLGWFNPIQLWVQAQGGVVALSMNIFSPLEMAKVMRDQSFLQVLHHTNQSPAMIARASKAFGMNADEAVAFHKAWLKTGLADSVLVNADHAAAARGRGVAMDAFSRAADGGLFFYKAGELFNRRTAFATAYRQIHKGGELTDETLKQIVDKAHDLMLNMGKANRAAWQKGILGVGTQFQQVSAKTIETLLGLNGNFSKRERGKILLGQGLLYGGAGVPLGNWGSQMLMEAFGYKTQVDLEREVGPEVIKLVNEGVSGWFALAVLGVDVNVGERSALIDGVEGLADDILFGEGTLAGNLLGAFTGPAGEFWKGFVGEYEPLSLGMAEDRPIDVVKALANPFLASIRSFRNADKAYFMNQFHKIVDRNYNTVVNGPFTFKEELAVAFGWTLNREIVTRSLDQANEVKLNLRKNVVNNIVRINYQAAIWANAGEFNLERREMVAEAIAVFYQSLDNNYERKQARDAVFNKLKDGRKSKEEQAWHTYLRTHSENTVDNAFRLQDIVRGRFDSLQTALGEQGVRRQGVYDNRQEQQ